MAKDAAGIDCSLPSTLPAPTFPTPTSTPSGRESESPTCNFSPITPFLSSVIGDGAGHISVGSSAVFMIRAGSVDGGDHQQHLLDSDSERDANSDIDDRFDSDADADGYANTDSDPDQHGQLQRLTDADAKLVGDADPDTDRDAFTVTFYGSSTSTDALGGGLRIYRREPDRRHPIAVTFVNTSTGSNPQAATGTSAMATPRTAAATTSLTRTTRGIAR